MHRMHRTLTVVAVSLLHVLGVLAPVVSHAAAKEMITTRWYIFNDHNSKENLGVWTNYMPKNGGNMIKVDLVDKTNPHTGLTAIRVGVVKFEKPDWAGLAVASKPDYWGETPSDQAYDLSKARKLVFHARADKPVTIQVKVAIAGDKKYGDSAKFPAATHWITLEKAWTKYVLPLDGIDLKRVITPFAFVLDKAHNSEGTPLTFFLDEIYFTSEES